jgi:mRNA interferase RelE/StbE
MGFENRVLISRKALKELSSLPDNERELLKDRISKLAFFPLARLDVQKLRGYANVYRPRVGDYRCLLYTSPSPRDRTRSRMPSSA